MDSHDIRKFVTLVVHDHNFKFKVVQNLRRKAPGTLLLAHK